MELSTFLKLLVAISIPNLSYSHTPPQGPQEVEQWFQNLPEAKERLTKLHFYFHDTVTGANPTAITVLESNFTRNSPTLFGLARVMDDPLTVGPEPDSKIVGRAQGMYTSASLDERAYLMTLNFVFTAGKYNGSRLSVVGHNPILHKYREMPVVGGSAAFRLARGVAIAQTYWFNASAFNAIVEYTVFALHY